MVLLADTRSVPRIRPPSSASTSFRLFHPGQHGARFHQEQRARLRQLDPSADAVEQPGAVPPFQGRDGGAHRRLRHVQRLRRTG